MNYSCSILYHRTIIIWQSKIKSIKIKIPKNKLFLLANFYWFTCLFACCARSFFFLRKITSYIGQEHLKENCNIKLLN